MAKKNYYDDLHNLEAEVVDEILKELKRVGKDFTIDDVDEIEFWQYSTAMKENIVKISVDGMIVCENGEQYSIGRAVSDGMIPLHDAISILNDLRSIKK